MKTSKHLLGLIAALLFSTAGLLAQTTSGGTTSGGTTGGTTSTGTTSGGTSTGTTSTGTEMHGKANPHTPNAHASDTAKAVQAALQKFDASRDQFMADRKALLDKLAAATTEADKQAIRDQLNAMKDQREQVGKQIRDEIKTLREQRKGGGG
jgi:acyl-CoA reductase-like NAD-dependent aldehyde dehydrogenase